MANVNYTNQPESSSKDELGKYFDPYIYENIEYLTLNGINAAKLIIVFWDISKFSDLCNEIMKKPGSIFNSIEYLLREYYIEAAELIKKNGGILDKFIGDGIFAYFGYQNGISDDLPSKVVNTALELRNKFKEIKEKHKQTLHSHFNLKSSVDINLKCGMHIGKVLFGYWHSPLRAQITAIGDEINFCSRLESFADRDQIIISEQLKNIIKNDFATKEIEIPEDKKLKSYEYVKYVYEILVKDPALATIDKS